MAEIRAMGRRAVALQADLLDEAQWQALIPAAVAGAWRAVDRLVNNASIFEYDKIATATRASWDRHMDRTCARPSC